MKSRLIKALPFVAILCVWFIFSYPYFIKGKVPYPSTYQVNQFAPWSSYPKFWGPVKNGAMPDVTTQIYPWKRLTIESLKSGEIPLWDPYSFSGTPHLANYQSAVFSPFNILFFILSFIDAWSILVLLQPLLAGIFTYIFARSLSISIKGALVSSFSFMFCGFITVWMDYGTLGYAILFLPLALFSIEKYYSLRKTMYLILLSITIPLSFFSGHFQISFYFLLSICLYQLYKLFLNKDFKFSVRIFLFILCGLCISSIQLLPSIELYLQSYRSILFSSIEAIPVGYIATLVAPDFLGNPVTRNDWFGHYAEWNGYIGLFPLIFSSYALFLKKEKNVLFFSGIGIFSLLCAFQTPFVGLLVSAHLPVLSTSSLSRVIVLFSFSFAILAGFGFDLLVDDLIKRRKRLFILVGSYIAVFIVMWVILLFHIFIPLKNIPIAKSNLLFPAVMLSAFTVLLFGAFFTNFKKRIRIVSLFFILIVAFDMLRFATKWQPFDLRALVFPDVPITKFFQKIAGFKRSFGNLGGEGYLYYHLPSVEGYDALYLKRYGEFIASVQNGVYADPGRSVVLLVKDSPHTPLILNFLGVKYIIHKLSDGHASWTLPFWTYPSGQFVLIFKDTSYEVYENRFVFPRVFLVNKYRVILNSKEIIKSMFGKNINLRSEAILEKTPEFNSSDKASGITEIKKYSGNNILISVSSKTKSLLVLTDSYYSGWKARVDGIETPILRADYTFRSVIVPSGHHEVVFSYEPLSFQVGMCLAGGGIFGILLLSILYSRQTTQIKKLIK